MKHAVVAAWGAAFLGVGALAGGCEVHGYGLEAVCQDPTFPGATDPGGPCHDAGTDAAACGDAGPDAGDDCADAGADAETDTAMATGFDPAQPELCPEQCVPREPLGWSEPVLLWIGPPDQAPDCPAAAPSIGYEGHADFTAAPPRACPACLCDAPDASCELLDPGTCEPVGGEPTGGVALLGAATFCCRPAPMPEPVPT